MLTEGFNILAIIFELTIFILFCLFVRQLFVNYVLPFLYEEIEQIKKHEIDLNEKDKLLDLSKISLDKKIKEQDENLFVLEKKVQVWRQFLNQKQEEKHVNSELILHDIKAKRSIQENNLRISKTEKLVIPRAVELAYQDIAKIYSGEKGEALLKDLIIKIEPLQTGNKVL